MDRGAWQATRGSQKLVRDLVTEPPPPGLGSQGETADHPAEAAEAALSPVLSSPLILAEPCGHRGSLPFPGLLLNWLCISLYLLLPFLLELVTTQTSLAILGFS